MKQGITIVTWSGGKEQFQNLWNSMSMVKYPVLIVVNDGLNVDWVNGDNVLKVEQDTFELGAIKITLTYTDWDEFILLQDTFEIKDISIFDHLFNDYPGRSVAYNPHFQMYLGKFRREVLNGIVIPEAHNKIEAVKQEGDFTYIYRKLDDPVIFNPEFRDENFYNCWEEKWGRKNLVLQDQYLIKRKGTWNSNQL